MVIFYIWKYNCNFIFSWYYISTLYSNCSYTFKSLWLWI